MGWVAEQKFQKKNYYYSLVLVSLRKWRIVFHLKKKEQTFYELLRTMNKCMYVTTSRPSVPAEVPRITYVNPNYICTWKLCNPSPELAPKNAPMDSCILLLMDIKWHWNKSWERYQTIVYPVLSRSWQFAKSAKIIVILLIISYGGSSRTSIALMIRLSIDRNPR